MPGTSVQISSSRARELEIWTDVPGMFSANPRATPAARQLRSLSYDEAQEIATAGAKVLHPRCLLPVRQHGIPLVVYATQAPQMGGTRISAAPAGEGAQVKAVCAKNGVTLVAMDSPGMWHQVGFLADAFAVFKRHGLSVDLVSTSETSVTDRSASQGPRSGTPEDGVAEADAPPMSWKPLETPAVKLLKASVVSAPLAVLIVYHSPES